MPTLPPLPALPQIPHPPPPQYDTTFHCELSYVMVKCDTMTCASDHDIVSLSVQTHFTTKTPLKKTLYHFPFRCPPSPPPPFPTYLKQKSTGFATPQATVVLCASLLTTATHLPTYPPHTLPFCFPPHSTHTYSTHGIASCVSACWGHSECGRGVQCGRADSVL